PGTTGPAPGAGGRASPRRSFPARAPTRSGRGRPPPSRRWRSCEPVRTCRSEPREKRGNRPDARTVPAVKPSVGEALPSGDQPRRRSSFTSRPAGGCKSYRPRPGSAMNPPPGSYFDTSPARRPIRRETARSVGSGGGGAGRLPGQGQGRGRGRGRRGSHPAHREGAEQLAAAGDGAEGVERGDGGDLGGSGEGGRGLVPAGAAEAAVGGRVGDGDPRVGRGAGAVRPGWERAGAGEQRGSGQGG